MNGTKVFWKCAEDALDSLEESTMQTIAWQMSERGVEMAPDSFDVKRFAVMLNELLGAGSETVLNLICRNLCKHLKMDFPVDPRVPVLEKISRIMETKKMNYMPHANAFDPVRMRRNLVLTLIISIVVANSHNIS